MRRILWVEDEGKIELIQYKAPLVRGGYSVDIASDATEAIQLISENDYAAIIFDLIIPCGIEFKSDNYCVGLDLIRGLINGEIEGVGKYPASWMIVFSVINDVEIHKEIRDLGIKTILRKKLNELDDLKNCVDELFKEE